MDVTVPYLSIIIPFYNVPLDVFENCLKSVCCKGASSDDLEVIVVNDGSPTSPDHVISKQEFRTINYIEQKNTGLSGARNIGMKIAKGVFVLFLDGDDYLVPNGVNELLGWIKENEEKEIPADLLRIGYHITSSHDIQNDNSNLNTIRSRVSEYFWAHNMGCTVWQNVFRRELVSTKDNPLTFYPSILHEDELWTPQLMLRMRYIDVTSKKIYCYHINNDSIMRNPNFAKSDRDWIVVVRELKKLSDSRGNKKDYFEARFRKAILARVSLLLYQGASIDRIEDYICNLKRYNIKKFKLLQGGVNFKMRMFGFLFNYLLTRKISYRLLMRKRYARP